MITLSLNFDGITGRTERASREKKVKEIVDTHLTFPGSDKLKLGVTIKDNGSSSVSFAGPKDIVDEAKRLWHKNVAPAVNRVKSVAAKASKSVSKASKSVKTRVSRAKAPKVRVTVKKAARKKAAPKKKKK